MKNIKFRHKTKYLGFLILLIPFYISCAAMTPLTQAAKDGNPSAISALLNSGANINEPNSKHGWTPLYWAIYYQRPDIVQTLLNNGAAVNIQDADSNSPLMMATSGGMATIVRALLEKGADVNTKNTLQETPLIHAVKAANEELVKILICKGADIEGLDISGYHAISYAEYYNSIDIAQLLYKAKYAKRRNVSADITQLCSREGIQQEKIKIVELPSRLYAHSINYHNIRPLLNYTGNRSIAVVVQDQRPYVLSRYNGPEYVGFIRADSSPFRGPMYVSTLTGRPLNEEISYCINETLKWQGFKPVSVHVQPHNRSSDVMEKIKSTNADRAIVISIAEWQSRAECEFIIPYSNRCATSTSGLSYGVFLTVLDEKGQEIARSQAYGKDDLGSNYSLSMFLSHFEKVQESAERIFQKLLNSSEVRLALQ